MCGTGHRGWGPESRPSLPPLRSARTPVGYRVGMGVGAARQPPLHTQRLQLCGRESAILSSICSEASCRVPQTLLPRQGACCQAQGCREGAVGRARAPAGLWGLASLPLRPPPHESRCIGTCGVEGAKADLAEVPSLRSPAPGPGMKESFPLSRPRGSSGPQPWPRSFSRRVKRGGVPAGNGRGACVAGRSPCPWGRCLRA